MSKFLGETLVDTKNHPTFKNYSESDWAMIFISQYGQIEGNHHKAWVLDQVSRILKGTKVVVKEAAWADGTTEFRYDVSEITSMEYNEWRQVMSGQTVNHETEYNYDEGVCP